MEQLVAFLKSKIEEIQSYSEKSGNTEYTDTNGINICGQSVSFLHSQASAEFKGISNSMKFESILESNGFKIVDGLGLRNRKCRIVVMG